MDAKLKKALEFSNYKKTLAIKRETLKEKLESRLIYGFAGGIFRIDQSLMNFVQMLIDQDRKVGIPIVDSNGNPILIEDLEKFREEIFDRYFQATLEYFKEFEKIKKSRNVEKLVEYE
jgi:hypothetical protein